MQAPQPSIADFLDNLAAAGLSGLHGNSELNSRGYWCTVFSKPETQPKIDLPALCSTSPANASAYNEIETLFHLGGSEARNLQQDDSPLRSNTLRSSFPAQSMGANDAPKADIGDSGCLVRKIGSTAHLDLLLTLKTGEFTEIQVLDVPT